MTVKIKKSLLEQKLICSNNFGTYFGVSQQVLDRVWNSLTGADGNSVVYISMEIGADPDVFHPLKDFFIKNKPEKKPEKSLQDLIDKYLNGPRKIPNYSGGLGVLAGDTLKSFADTHIPVAAVSLLYREGYFSQLVDSKVGQSTRQPTGSRKTLPPFSSCTSPAIRTGPLKYPFRFLTVKNG